MIRENLFTTLSLYKLCIYPYGSTAPPSRDRLQEPKGSILGIAGHFHPLLNTFIPRLPSFAFFRDIRAPFRDFRGSIHIPASPHPGHLVHPVHPDSDKDPSPLPLGEGQGEGKPTGTGILPVCFLSDHTKSRRVCHPAAGAMAWATGRQVVQFSVRCHSSCVSAREKRFLIRTAGTFRAVT